MDRVRGKRRIVYGVHGYGRGHASRAQAVLPELTRRYDVLVLAGDEAYDQLHNDYDVVRIPVLRYWHKPSGRPARRRTLWRGVKALGDMRLGGPGSRLVEKQIRQFEPDVVISDSEGWTHHAARRLGIGRISFDHYGILVHCHLPLSRADKLAIEAESVAYRRLVARPERAIVVAFYDGQPKHEGVTVVGPLLRQQAREMPDRDGEHLLAYFSNADANFTPQIARALQKLGSPVRVYGPKRIGREGRVTYCPVGNEPFLCDLASCRAVFATAGNQLISEAIHFGKPLLLMPEQSLEQRLNAQYVQRWNAGMQTRPRDVTGELLREFLSRRDEFAANVVLHRRDGLADAMAAIDLAVEELTS